MQSVALRTSAALSGQCQAALAGRSLRAARPPPTLCALPAIPRAAAQLPSQRFEEPSTSAPAFSSVGRLCMDDWGLSQAGLQNKRVKRGVVTVAQAASVAAPAAGSGQQVAEKRVSSWSWNYNGKPFNIYIEEWGSSDANEAVLFLPALSDVSTTDEFREVAEAVANTGRRAVALDWPGFGLSGRPQMEYSSDVLVKFIGDFVSAPNSPLASSGNVSIVGAGHSASLVVKAIKQGLLSAKALIAVAPTWAGPLPIVFGREPKVQNRYNILRTVLRSPGLGWALYKFVLSSPKNIRNQYRTHVYSSKDNITDDLIGIRTELTQREGARFAPAAFVTGDLDPYLTRDELLSDIASLDGKVPLFVLKSIQSPKRSKAEMDALKGVKGVKKYGDVPGALLPHEEFPQDVATKVLGFLDGLKK